MTRLVRIGMVNWHLLPAMDLPVTGHIGVIGENRSGKSTLLDLIQTVITGNDRRLLRLNASANDSGRKRGDRSVHAYCLGRLGDDSLLRSEARTVIYLCFDDARPGGGLVTIGLALEATERERSERVVAQFIAQGIALSVADVVTRQADGREGTRDWGQMRPLLEARCAEAGGRLAVFRDEPGRYVAEYLRLLSTGRRAIAPDAVLKAFVNALSFEQIPSATAFVRRHLLDDDPIRINDLRQSIATYHQLRRDIVRLREKLGALEALKEAVEAHAAQVHDHDRHRWLEARAGLDHARAGLRAARTARDEAHIAHATATGAIDRATRCLADATADKDALRDAIASQAQGGGLQTLAQDKRALTLERAETARRLADLRRLLHDGLAALRHRALLTEDAPALLRALDRLAEAARIGATPPEQATPDQGAISWPADPAALAAALDDPALADAAPLAERLSQAADQVVKSLAGPERTLADLQAEIRAIRTTGVAIDPRVAALVAELQAQGLRPRILGQLLRVTDDGWREAVEALLGRDREAILVDPARVDEAIRHLQANRQRLRGCRVVNSRKIDPADCRPEPGTLASVLAADDPAAMAFVIRRLGGVRLAETRADLHRPGRAILRDGTYDDGLTVELRSVVGGHRIGSGAGRSTLPDLEAEATGLTRTIAAAEDRIRAHRAAAAALVALAGAAGRGREIGDLADRLAQLETRLAEVDAALAEGRRTLAPDLHARLRAVEEALRRHDAERTEAIRAQQDAKTAISLATRTLSAGEQTPGSGLACRRAWIAWRGRRALLSRAEGRALYAEARDRVGGDLERLARESGAAALRQREAIQTKRNQVFDRYLACHTLAGTRPDFSRDAFSVSGDIAPWVEDSIRHIRETELVRYEADAVAAEEKTRNIFQHSFAYELRQRFAAKDRVLQKINRTLRAHEFHYERYRFVDRPVEAMRPIIDLVRASETDDTLFARLFDRETIGPDDPHADALQTIHDLLLSDGLDLEAFEDYRRYFTFDLIMTDGATGRQTNLDSRRGTGSGAEQQVPFYVAIGSALAAAYHDKAAGDPAAEKGLGLAVFDEAFSKLDGRNQKACMAFYDALGLQVIVAAPAERRATLYETMNTFVETIRTGDSIEVDVCEIRARTREAFLTANPANISLETFRALLATQPGAPRAGVAEAAGVAAAPGIALPWDPVPTRPTPPPEPIQSDFDLSAS